MAADASNPARQGCILAALQCAEACRQVETIITQPGDDRGTPERIVLLRDCADLLMTAARLLDRDSPRHAEVWAVAVESALAWAAHCLATARGHAMLLECAAACQRCAQRWQETQTLHFLTAAPPEIAAVPLLEQLAATTLPLPAPPAAAEPSAAPASADSLTPDPGLGANGLVLPGPDPAPPPPS